MGIESRKAQQLVEFALVLPILVIILMVIIEIGFALNMRLSLTEAVKLSVAQAKVSSEQTGNTFQDKLDGVQSSILNSLKSYFTSHNLPYSDTLMVNIMPSGNDMALVMVNYKYTPLFTLPNMFGGEVIPSQYSFSSTQVINSALLDMNNEASGFSASDLSSFGKTSTDFDPRTSVLTNQTVDGIDVRKQIAFLVGFNSDHEARLFNWWGMDLLPQNIAFNLKTGTLEVKSPYYNGGSWFDTLIPYNWVLSSMGFTQALYAKTDSYPSFNTTRAARFDLTSSDITLNVGIPWYNQTSCDSCGSGDPTSTTQDMSSNNMDNLVKRGLSFLYSAVGDASGGVDSMIMTNPPTSLAPVQNYTFVKPYGGSYNLLKLFVPNTPAVIKPNDDQNGFNYSFNIDNSTGELTSSGGTAVDIVDCYIDSDGDGIPNAWDKDPQYFDADGDGKLDGEENSISNTFSMPDTLSSSNNTFTNDFTFKSYSPYLLNGNLNNTFSDNPYTSFVPPSYSVTTVQCSATSPTSPSFCAQHGVGNALYVWNGSVYTRKVTNWQNSSDKLNFIYGNSNSLKESTESSLLDSTAFGSKVIFQ